jgi:hypothetical protein
VTHTARRTASQLARAVGRGRSVREALGHLDAHGSEPDAAVLADALARFLVDRCESHHAGWRVVRQVVVESAAHAPWEKSARRAVPQVAQELLTLAVDGGGRTPLARAQHVAAQCRAQQIARHVDPDVLLADLRLDARAVSEEHWEAALRGAVEARSRHQVARQLDRAARD